jgi:serine/threonine-protein kinase
MAHQADTEMAVIDRDRWREIGPLLDQALELTKDARATWLNDLRSRSPELAVELAALLARDDAADREGFLGTPVNVEAPENPLAGIDLAAYLQSGLRDRFTIERELGSGGMGRVFLAREHALGRTVVIKVLLPAFAAGIRAERFAREVRLAAALQHPNVVPLFSAGEVAGLPYYVMPYVRGESLRARLTRDGRLSLVAAVSVLRDVARALAFAHEQGVVHRDVKPENVLLAGDAAVVTDFGIAKAISASSQAIAQVSPGDATLSEIGSTIGTPAYMAPEQVAGDPRTDHRADIYAWGVLAYELLAGSHPFAERRTPQQLLAAHLSEMPAPLIERTAALPSTLSALVMRCLEKDPARRPQSAREILDALANIATPATVGVVEERPVVKRSPRIALASVGFVLLALVAYFVAARTRNSPASRTPAVARSLGVLPFEAVGGDTANAYFAEGIADEIAAMLSKVGGLRVASRTSAAAFRSTHNLDVRELGRRLGVTTVLEGRVRRAGDRMRLTVQLTSVEDGLTLWSDMYERDVRDVFQVQDEIARSIVGALRAGLPGMSGPQRAASLPGTNNPEAYDLYLRATHLLERRGSSVVKAVEYFERAIAEDSTFARAYAGLSYAFELTPTFGGAPLREAERRATEAARRALALDSTLAEAYTALGMAHVSALRWREAGEAHRRAVEADPGYAPGLYQYAHYLMRVGRIDEAVEFCRRARIADPLSGTASMMLAYTLSLLGRYDESLAESRRAYELDSSLATVRSFVPLALLHDGHPKEAHDLARGAITVPFNGIAAYVLGATGDRAAAEAVVRELEARSRSQWYVRTALAYAYLGLGDTARALSALEAAARVPERPPHAPFVDPMFDAVRQSERFAAVVRRLGLDERLFTSRSGGRPR